MTALDPLLKEAPGNVTLLNQDELTRLWLQMLWDFSWDFHFLLSSKINKVF